MRNLAKVASLLNCNIESLTIRLSTNCRLRHFSTEKAQPTKTHRRNNADIDERILLATSAIKKHASRSSRHDRYFRVLDQEVAKQFAHLIMSDPAKNPSYVAEINSAYGLLTRELLDAGLPRINLFESLEYFHPELSLLEEKYPGRVKVNKMSFDAVCYAGLTDSLQFTNEVDELLNSIETRSWDEEPTAHIIGAVQDNVLMTRLLSMVIHRITLGKYGRMVIHLAIPEPVWATLSSGNENYTYYGARGILFQMLFNYRVLGTLPAAGFYPKSKKRSGKVRRRRMSPKYDKNIMCVVRMEAKCDLHKHNLTERDIVPLYHFVKYHYKKRTNRIIPELEKWVPGCGRELIAAGYDIFTEFGELLPDEIIKLFLLFKSLPGYEKSNFLSMLNTFPIKIDEQSVFGTTTDKVDEMFKLSKDATNAQTARDESSVDTNPPIGANDL